MFNTINLQSRELKPKTTIFVGTIMKHSRIRSPKPFVIAGSDPFLYVLIQNSVIPLPEGFGAKLEGGRISPG